MDRVTVIPNFAYAQTLDDLKRILVREWSEMANLVNNCFTLYVQTTQPTIPNNTTSLWQNTTTTPNKYYLVCNFGGTHQVIQLTSDGRPEFQKARAYRAAAMNISGDTKVALDTDSYDPANITDLTNSRIKPTIAGYYHASAQVSFDLPAGQNGQVMLKRQTTVISYGNYILNSTADALIAQLVVSDTLYLDGVNDYIELWANASSSSAINGGATDCYLSVVGPF